MERKVAWDRFVSECPSGHFMQSYAWGEFKNQSGWRAEYLLATRNNLPVAAALLLSRTVPLMGMRIYALPRGPSVREGDRYALVRLLEQVVKHVRKQRGILLRADPYFIETTEYDDAFREAGFRKIERAWSFWNSPKYVFWLDLEQGLESILNRMPKKKRHEIRSAYKKGVLFFRGGMDDLGAFYALISETADRKGIGVHEQAYYRKLYRILGESMTPQLFLGQYEGETVAAGISLAYGNKAWLLYLGSSNKHFYLTPNRALQWEMIQWAYEKGCSRYDFRGTATDDPPHPKSPGFGVYKFKKSFGPVFIRTAGYYDAVGAYSFYRLFRIVEDSVLPFVIENAVKCRNLIRRFIG